MKANALVLLAVSVVACGALLPEVKDQKAEASAIPEAQSSQPGKSSTAISASGAPEQMAAPKPDVVQPEPKFSSGIADIVKLVKAGVGTSIIEAYIQNSNVAYYPSAEEILRLHNLGVPPELLQALIKRGGEMRSQQAQAIKENSERLAQQQTVAPVAPVAAESPSQIVVQSVQPASPPITYNYYYSDAPYYSPPLYYPRYNYGYVSPFYSSYSYGIGSSHFYRPRYSSFYTSYPRHSLNVVCRTPLGFPRYTSIRPSLHHSLSGRHRF